MYTRVIHNMNIRYIKYFDYVFQPDDELNLQI